MKYRISAVFFALVGLIGFSACDDPAGSFPVIGLDQDGQAQQVMVPENEYSSRLGTLVSTANDSILPVMKTRDEDAQWMVRTFLMGIGVNATIGLGSAKVGVVPQIRVAFTNSSSPTLP